MDWNTPPTAAEMAASKQDNFESPPTPEEIAASKDPWATPPTAEEMAQSKSHGVSQTARDYLVNGVAFGKGAQLRALMRPRIDLGPDGHVVAGASQDYETSLASNKADQDAEKAQHPYWATGSEMVGAALPMMAATALTGGAAGPLAATRAARLATAGVNGVLQGAGHSDSNTVGGVAGDSAVGGVLGVGGGLLGEGVGSAASALAKTRPGQFLLSLMTKPAQFFRGKAVGIEKKLSDQATQTVAEEVANLRNGLGTETQRGADAIRNLEEFDPELAKEAVQRTIPELKTQIAATTIRPESLPAIQATEPGSITHFAIGEADRPNVTALDLQSSRIADAEAKLNAAEAAAPQRIQQIQKELRSGVGQNGNKTLLTTAAEHWPTAAGALLGAPFGWQGALTGGVTGEIAAPFVKYALNKASSPAGKILMSKVAAGALTPLEMAGQQISQGDLLRQVLAGGSVPFVKSGAPQSAGQYLLEKLQARQGKKNE